MVSLPEPPEGAVRLTVDITITPLRQPGAILDPLTDIAREGARQMLAAAESFVARFFDERLPDGRQSGDASSGR